MGGGCEMEERERGREKIISGKEGERSRERRERGRDRNILPSQFVSFS